MDALADADIDFSDVPEVTAELFARAVVRKGLKPVTTSPLGASGEPVIKPR